MGHPQFLYQEPNFKEGKRDINGANKKFYSKSHVKQMW
jgi:hypothetical protein